MAQDQLSNERHLRLSAERAANINCKMSRVLANYILVFLSTIKGIHDAKITKMHARGCFVECCPQPHGVT